MASQTGIKQKLEIWFRQGLAARPPTAPQHGLTNSLKRKKIDMFPGFFLQLSSEKWQIKPKVGKEKKLNVAFSSEMSSWNPSSVSCRTALCTS
jgi:hypothetical protein